MWMHILIVLGALFFLTVAATSLWIRFHPPSTKLPKGLSDLALQEEPATSTKVDSKQDLFNQARELILTHQYKAARDHLRKMEHSDGMSRPDSDWVHLLQGLAELLDKRMESAHEIFRLESQLPPFTAESDGKELADFFTRISSALAEGDFYQPVLAATSEKKFRSDNFEIFGLLLIGIKDWTLGAVDEGAKWLWSCQSDVWTSETAPVVGDYFPLAESRLHDLSIYQKISAKVRSLTAKNPSSRQERLALIEMIDDSQKKLINHDKIFALLDFARASVRAQQELAAGITNGKTVLPKDRGSVDAAQKDDTEKRSWQAARETAILSIRQYRFAEAHAVLERAKSKNPEYRDARSALLLIAKELSRFKKTLIDHINNTGGYPGSVWTRSGLEFVGGVKFSGDDSLYAITGDGLGVRLGWREFDPATLLTMANYFDDRAAVEDEQVELRWSSAFFALHFGLIDQAKVLGAWVAAQSPEYKPLYDKFFVPPTAMKGTRGF